MAVIAGVAKTAKNVAWDARPQIMCWLRGEFYYGVVAVFHGLFGGNHRLEARTVASRKVRCFSVVFSLVSFIVLAVLWLVFFCLMWIISFLFTLFNGSPSWVLELALSALTFTNVLQTVVFTVPLCTVLFLHYWAYDDEEKVFCAALRQKHLASGLADQEHLSNLADALEILPAESLWAWLQKYVSTVARGGCMGLGLVALSYVPWLGPIIYPVVLFWKRGRHVGHVPAAVLIVTSFLPSLFGLPAGRLMATWGLQVLLTARCTAKELLYTLTIRANGSQKRALGSQHHARITGFGVAAATVLSIPVIGPLFWFDLVQIAAELMGDIAVMEERNVFDLSSEVEAFKLQKQREKEEKERRELEKAQEKQRRAIEREQLAHAKAQEKERQAAEQQASESRQRVAVQAK